MINITYMKIFPFLLLCIGFSALWIPMGQEDFLIVNWMKLSTFYIPFILFTYFSKYQEIKSSFVDMKLMAVWMLVIYMIHQFEEHWVDMLGHEYAFYWYANHFLRNFLGIANENIEIINKTDIFVINTSLVWLIGYIAIWRSPTHNFPAFSMIGIILVNALVHIAGAIINLTYNPGLLTAVTIFFPFSFFFYKYALKRRVAQKYEISLGILWAFLAHVIMIVGLISTGYLRLFSREIYYIVLVLWSVVPLFICVPKIKDSAIHKAL